MMTPAHGFLLQTQQAIWRVLTQFRLVIWGMMMGGCLITHAWLGPIELRGVMLAGIAQLVAIGSVWWRGYRVSAVVGRLHATIDLLGISAVCLMVGSSGGWGSILLLSTVIMGAMVIKGKWVWVIVGIALLCEGWIRLWPLFSTHHRLVVADAQMMGWVHLITHGGAMMGSILLITWLFQRFNHIQQQQDQFLQGLSNQLIRDRTIAHTGYIAIGSAHDMATPLATILMLLETTPLPIDGIRNQVARCRNAIDGLLAASRVPQSDAPPISLHDALSQCRYEPMAITITGDSHVMIPDPIWFKSAITGIFDNAIQAGCRVIACHYESNEQTVRLTIQNDGPPFATVSQKPKRVSTNDDGLGLQLARIYCERWGGQVTLWNHPTRVILEWLPHD